MFFMCVCVYFCDVECVCRRSEITGGVRIDYIGLQIEFTSRHDELR